MFLWYNNHYVFAILQLFHFSVIIVIHKTATMSLPFSNFFIGVSALYYPYNNDYVSAIL